MPSNDNRLHYFLETVEGAGALPVPQSFLDQYPIIKEEGDEPEYYGEADGLTHLAALQKKFPERVTCLQVTGSGAPAQLGTLSDNGGVVPEHATHIIYGLPEIPTGKMLMDFTAQISQVNTQRVAAGKEPINPNHFMLRDPREGHSEVLHFLETGELPQ